MIWDEIALELARIEREAFDAVRRRIAARQLGEAWIDLRPILAESEAESALSDAA